MRIRWTPAAAAELPCVSAADHAQAVSGDPFPEGIATSRPAGSKNGLRELLFPPLPYVAVYRVSERSLEVLRICHTVQDRQSAPSIKLSCI
jgi:plasmid stabilization system protein ParE